MYTYPTGGLPRNEAIASGHAELWSIMALASFQIKAALPDPETERYRNIARSLIPLDHGFQLGHIKALLLLSLIEVTKQAWGSAWLMAGSAVRVLTHFNIEKGLNTTHCEGRSKHTLLAAFILEHAISYQTGALPHIRTADIQNIGFLTEDGLEEWSPWQDPTRASTTTRFPTRSISTFNELVRIAFRRSDSHPESPKSGVVLALLQNASLGEARLHPSTVLERLRLKINTAVGREQSISGHIGKHSRTTSAPLSFTNPFMEPHSHFMLVPEHTTSPLVTDTALNRPQSATTPTTWPGGIQEPSPLNQGATGGDGDIFEELAMLERTDSTTNPSFMQNLGFGPDLDLAEFFGADYQPSDPLLVYMQQGNSREYDASKNR
jgi:hypothetical protein